jgi:GT2 family glycosyltransferase
MSRRYLFGPVTADFAQTNLREARARGDCLAFNLTHGADLSIAPTDSWGDVCRGLPVGWQPDFIALWLPYTQVPACLWSAPVPLVCLAADWQILWHGYRRRLQALDLVLTDTLGVRALAKEGTGHARAANLYGCAPGFVEELWPEGPRDIDVLFVGNFHPAIQSERLAWLGRLAQLGKRWRIELHAGVFGADYRRMLARARIVFNRAVRGECNLRVAEALAAGALLFQEAENREVPALLTDRHEYVAYADENFEEVLHHYLEHEDERAALAAAARRCLHDFTFEALWQQALETIDGEWPELVERSQKRVPLDPDQELLARAWQAWSSQVADTALPAALAAALVSQPSSAELHNALGLAVTHAGQAHGPLNAALVRQAAGCFGRAVETDPSHLVAALNLVETLAGLEQKAHAVQHGRRLLALVERAESGEPAWLDAAHFPPGFDVFRVEWERAAWSHAGDRRREAHAKRALLRWRLHTLLGSLTDDLGHYHEAVLARPDLPTSRAALGCALGRAGRSAEAVPHLRQAVTANPFDLEAARAFFQALGDCGDSASQVRFAQERILLSRAAPKLVPAEAWFHDLPATGGELASIIILCCNELQYTQLCLESVLRHTRPPYELILIDNASTDGTPDYLEALRRQTVPQRVEVIHNYENLGFPKGCNQGLSRAQGRFVVLLNNDTIVTPSWLEGLTSWTAHPTLRAGLVGPTSNYCPPPQQVAAEYADLRGLNAFAEKRRRDWAGKALQVGRLTGFCLLVRREVFETVGGFDEGYGRGFFDDDDLCVRAREAGFRLLLAQNVYIHHFGSRTFAGQGIDCHQQLHSNYQRFQAKWGPERAAGYKLPEPGTLLVAPAPSHPPEAFRLDGTGDGSALNEGALVAPTAVVGPHADGRRMRFSLCLIVKNEEANLSGCLKSAGDLFDEIVVVDTGSDDRTKEVAVRFGAKVFDFSLVRQFLGGAQREPASCDGGVDFLARCRRPAR